MKKLTLLFILTAVIFAQQSKPVESCGLGENKGHPCHCMAHWSQAQNEYMDKCQGKDQSVKKLTECLRDMPETVRDHCRNVESYGNWADESKPMPNQCTSACKHKDCRCADGAQHPGPDSKTVCHFGVYQEDSSIPQGFHQ